MPKTLTRKDFLLLLLYASGPKGQKAEPIRGRTRLAKLLFLLKEEGWAKKGIGRLASDYYEFQPDDFGPFDVSVFVDVDFFRSIGFLQISNVGPLPSDEANEYLNALQEWSLDNDLVEEIYSLEERFFEQEIALTETGIKFVQERILPQLTGPEQIEAFEFLKKTYGEWKLSKLLRYIYSTYPAMATKSKIRRQIMAPRP